MPGKTHQVGYDSDSVLASFQALRDATLTHPAIDDDATVHRPRAACEEFGDRATWSEIDPGLVDVVMPAAVSMAANFDSGGHGGL